MAELQLEMKGWKIPLGIAAVAGVLAFRYHAMQHILTPAQKQHLQLVLLGEYSAEHGTALRQAIDAGDQARIDELTAQINSQPRKVTFGDISTRGDLDDAVVRVEVLIDGVAPATKPVRYYRTKQRGVGSWEPLIETGSSSYYLKLF